MNNLKNTLWPQSLVDSILNWSKTYSIPGFNEVPVYNIVGFIIKELKADDITTRANSVAFNFFISLFPFIIFILPLIAQLPFVDDFWSVGWNPSSLGMPAWILGSGWNESG